TLTRGGAQWSYEHGPRGELQSVALPGGLGSFAYQYDALLQLSEITPPAGGLAAQTFAYDEFGRGTRRTRGSSVWATSWQDGTSTTRDPNGDVVERAFDGRGRVAREQYRPGGQSQSHTDLTAVAYAYDGLDQLLAAHEARNSGSVSNVYEYDARSRLVSSARGRDSVTYSYTSSGRKQTVTSPSGTVRYTYDPQDRVQSLTSSQGASVTVEWEPGGRLSRVSGNGVVEQYAYYGHGRIRSVSAMRDANPLTRYEYTYDDRGNRLEERYTERTAPVPEVTRYGYDLADRLTGVGYASGVAELYALGGDGSRREEKLVEGYLGSLGPDGISSATRPTRHWRYAYDTSGGLERIDDVLTGGVEARVTTDAGGRVVAEVRGGNTRQYGWDAGGRLASVKRMGAAPTIEATYSYGFDGLRRGRSEGGVGARYVWGAEGELLEEGPAVGPGLLYSGADLGMVAAGGERLLHDSLGSIVGRVGSSTHLFRYDPWGGLREGPSPAASLPGQAYAGQSLDASVGLSYAQQRWYDARTGRFLSEDPLLGNLEAPASLHSWAYAQANPTRFIDPRGESALEVHQDMVGHLDDLTTGVDQLIDESSDYYFEKYNSPLLATGIKVSAKMITGVPLGIVKWIVDPVGAAKESYQGAREQLGNFDECAKVFDDPFYAGGKCAGAIGTGAGLVVAPVAMRNATGRLASKSKGTPPTPEVAPPVHAPPPRNIEFTERRSPSRPEVKSRENGWLGGASLAPEPRNGWLGGATSRRPASGPARGYTPPTIRKYEPKQGGNTIDTEIGRRTHANRADVDRASGNWDYVDEVMADAGGANILVPKRVDLKTGRPIGDATMKAKPDGMTAPSRNGGTIMDNKPDGKGMHKQQIIRYITAYEQKFGVVPAKIEIQRYHKITGETVRVDVYSPFEYMPWRWPTNGVPGGAPLP
ncbi:MAG: RHS repeat-associated core domain-containing protein, partial [Cystobacter sp.]